MRKMTVIGLALLLALVLGLPNLQAQQQGPPSQGGWYCPWMGGTMHQGQGMGCCMMGSTARTNLDQPLTKEQAKGLLDDYLRNGSNPNLKVGEIADKGNIFEATIVTKDGSLVERIQVDKNTGWFRNVS